MLPRLPKNSVLNITLIFQKQRLMLSFPQASLSGQAARLYSAGQIRIGIPALFMNYFASGNNNSDNYQQLREPELEV